MEQHFDFFPLVIVSVLAVLVPIALHRIPKVFVPIVVGEILAGILVGPNGMGLIGSDVNSWLDFLKLFGFAYLMFISGLEIDFTVLRRDRPAGGGAARWTGGPLRAALLSFALTLGMSGLLGILLARTELVRDAAIMALVLSTTSLGIVAPVLRQRGLIRKPLGQYTLVAAVVGDFATVTLVSIYLILHTEGLTLEALFILVLLAVTFLAFRLAGLSQKHPGLARFVGELSHATAQLDTRGALALAVIFIALAQGLGVELILGAFMAGAIVSLLTEDEGSVLRAKLHALGYGFFIPIFFIMVGVDLDLQALTEAPQGWLVVPLLVVLAFSVKYAGCLIYRTLFGWRETFAIGSLMSSRLSLIIAVAAIGVELGVVSPAVNAAVVFVALVTVVVAPPLFFRLLPQETEVERRGVIVAGSTPQARLLAQRLRQQGEDVEVLTANRHLASEIRSLDLPVVVTEPGSRADGLAATNVDHARALVSMLDDDEESLRLTTRARDEFGVDTVVASVKDPRMTERFQDHGVHTINPSLSSVLLLQALILHPHVFSLVTQENVEGHLIEVRLRNPRLEGSRLSTVRLPGDALVMLIVRDGEVIVPRGHTRLMRNDLLSIVGAQDAVQAARVHLGA